jgi:hypothetical protein
VSFQQLVDTIQEELEAKKKFQIMGIGNNTSAKFYKNTSELHELNGNNYEGVNSMIYEENHNYLKDLQTQRKRRYYPNNAESSREFGHLIFPASSYTVSKSLRDIPKNVKEETPMSGDWAMRRSEPSLLDPAGQRKPKDFDKG